MNVMPVTVPVDLRSFRLMPLGAGGRAGARRGQDRCRA